MRKPTVFLIDEDNDSRPLLRESFKTADFKVSLAIDEEDALERVGNGCLKADLMLMNLLKKSPNEVLEIGREICNAGKINAPLVVIAQKFGEDLEGTNARFGENEYVIYLEDGEQLFDLIDRLIKGN
jgi:DNA-binding NtrC family response regulator